MSVRIFRFADFATEKMTEALVFVADKYLQLTMLRRNTGIYSTHNAGAGFQVIQAIAGMISGLVVGGIGFAGLGLYWTHQTLVLLSTGFISAWAFTHAFDVVQRVTGVNIPGLDIVCFVLQPILPGIAVGFFGSSLLK